MTSTPKNPPFSYSFERLFSQTKTPARANRIAEIVMRRIEQERKNKG